MNDMEREIYAGLTTRSAAFRATHYVKHIGYLQKRLEEAQAKIAALSENHNLGDRLDKIEELTKNLPHLERLQRLEEALAKAGFLGMPAG
jgi:TolA-binding protein